MCWAFPVSEYQGINSPRRSAWRALWDSINFGESINYEPPHGTLTTRYKMSLSGLRHRNMESLEVFLRLCIRQARHSIAYNEAAEQQLWPCDVRGCFWHLIDRECGRKMVADIKVTSHGTQS